MGHKTKKQQEAIRFMIHERLTARTLVPDEVSSDTHLDDDILSAFFEARLGDEESAPVIAHLVACAACRGVTAHLVRFESEVSDAPLPVTAEESPGSLRQWFEDFRAGLGSSGEEVFAYQNPPEDSEQNKPPPDSDETTEEDKSS
jgi:hypothetical protein